MFRCCYSPNAPGSAEYNPFGKCSKLWGATDLTSYDFGIWGGPNSVYYDASWYTPPEAHCQLLWDGGVIPATHTTTTLVDWCSLFVSDAFRAGEMDEKNWRRWRACIGGSPGQVVGMTALSLNDYRGYIDRICLQLLENVPWMPKEQREESMDLCMRASHPPVGKKNMHLWNPEGDY